MGGTDLNDDKLFAALNTLTIYDINRGELRRAEPIVAFVEPRRPSIPMGGAWGVMALFGGQLDVARPLIEQWKFDLALASQEFEDSWIVPFDYRAAACVGLGALRLLQGDLAGADAEFAEAADRSERAAFPKGPNTLAYVRFGQIWMCTESAQLDRAATLAADLLAVTERHGLDGWHLVGVVQHAAVSASISLEGGCDPADVAAQLETASRRLDTWQDAGYGAFRPMYDSVLARLLIAAGHHEEARRRNRHRASAGRRDGRALLRRRTTAAPRKAPSRSRHEGSGLGSCHRSDSSAGGVSVRTTLGAGRFQASR